MSAVNATDWRSHPATQNTYLWILIPDVVFARDVNMPSFSFPVSVLTFDGAGTGTFTDIKIGQTIYLKSSGGSLKGVARVRAAATSSTIPIGVISKGDIEITDGDRIEVVNERRLWSKVPRVESDGTLQKDWVLDFNAATAQPPVANGGVGYIGKVDPDTGLITVSFPSGDSYAIADGATIASRLWNVIDGTITVGTSGSTTITATFPAGYRYVELTVTDSNGNAHTTYILVVGIDPDTYPAFPVRVSRLGGSLASGWEGSFSLQNADVSNIPEGAAVMLWADESYDGTPGSLNGQAGREHIKFIGWTVGDLTRIEPLQSDYVVNAQNAQGMMSALDAFSQTTERHSSPSRWFEVATLTLWRHFHYLAHWHTTLFEVCPVERPAYWDDYSVLRLSADDGSVVDQFNFVFNAVRAKFTAGMRNEIYCRYNPHLMPADERAALTTVITLADSDWTDALEIESEHRPTVSTLRGSGVVPSATEVTAVLSAAPGSTPGQGVTQDSLDRQLATQADLNQRVGRLYNLRNLPRKNLPVTILNIGMVADPAWQELIKFTMGVDNKRGIAYTSDPFVLAGVDVTFDHENAVSLENWQLEYMTAATIVAGITVQVPGADAPIGEEYIASDGTYQDQPLPPYEFVIPDPYRPDEVGSGVFDTDSFLVAFNDTLAVASAGGTSDPDWAAIALTGDVASAVKMSSTRVMAATSSRLYDITDISTTPVTTLRQTISNMALLRKVAGLANAVAIYLKGVSASVSISDAFVSGLGPRTAFTSVSFPFYYFGVGGQWVSTGGRTNNGGCIQSTATGIDPPGAPVGDFKDEATVYLDLGAEYTVTAASMWHKAIVGSESWGWKIQAWDDNGDFVADLVDSFDNSSSTSYTQRSFAGSQAGVRYVSFSAVTNTADGHSLLDDISVTYNGVAIQVKFSDDGGVGIDSTQTVGADVGDFAFDVDDHGVGILVAAANGGIYFSTAYTGAFTQLTGLTIPSALATAQFIRVPYLRVSDGALNDDDTEFEFIYGIDTLIGGKSTFLVQFNAATGVVAFETNITPIIGGFTYLPVSGRGNVAVTYGGDTTKMLMFTHIDEEIEVVLLGSTSGGGGWTIRNSGFEGEFVDFIEPDSGGDGLKCLVAGVDGNGASANFGGTINGKDGTGGDSFGTATSDPASYGIISL